MANLRLRFLLSVSFALALMSVACEPVQEHHGLAIQFPSDALRDAIYRMRVMLVVVEVAEPCAAMLAGQATPGQIGYTIEDELAFSFPEPGPTRGLEVPDSGEFAFFIQALDAKDLVFLHGCTQFDAGAGQATTVELVEVQSASCEQDGECDDGQYCNGVERCAEGRCQNGTDVDCSDADPCTDDQCNESLDQCEHPAVVTAPATEGPKGDPSCSDQVDNDCDGLTDDADTACKTCQIDLECDDENECTADSCQDNSCSNQPVVDGQDCDDGAYCSVNDACTSGHCAGETRDCSESTDQCNDGVCDETADACVPAPVADDTDCDDGVYCTDPDSCQAGQCQGSQRNCDAFAGECENPVCNETSQQCESQPKENGADCDDGLYCTEGETCQAGSCEGGLPVDCSAENGKCVDGICDENLDACIGDPIEEGTGCEDGLYCTVGDTCDAVGNCVAGDDSPCQDACQSFCDEDLNRCNLSVETTPCPGTDDNWCTSTCDALGNCQDGVGVDCDDGQVCTQDSCAPATGLCTNDDLTNGTACLGSDADPCNSSCQSGTCQDDVPSTDGAACDDAVDCTVDDACDGAGGCKGSPSDAFCADIQTGDICFPDCATTPSVGCLTPPDSMNLDCDSPVDLGSTTDSACTLQVVGGDFVAQTACLQCQPQVGVLQVDDTDFDDGAGNCDQDGWSLVTEAICQSAVMGCNPSGASQACCSDFGSLCETATFGRPMMQVQRYGGCEEWRMHKTFDLRGLAHAWLCIETAEQEQQSEDGYLIFVQDGSHADEQVLCRNDFPVPGVDRFLYRECTPLPAWTADSQDVTITLLWHAQRNTTTLYLDRLGLWAWSSDCTPDTATALDENFESCDAAAWSLSGASPVCASEGCANHADWQPAQVVTGGVSQFDITLDAGDLDSAVDLCLRLGGTGLTGSDGVSVWLDAGAGMNPLWQHSGPVGAADGCQEFCFDLSGWDPNVNRHQALGLRVQLAASVGTWRFYGATLSGAHHCPASANTMVTSDLTSAGGGQYDFTATDAGGEPLPGEVRCTWVPDDSLSQWADVYYQ